jgi:putative transposase
MEQINSQNTDTDLTDAGCHLSEKGGNQGGNQNDKVATEKQAFLPKGGNQENDIWLSKNNVVALLSVTPQAVKKACKSGKFKTILVDGNGGKQYRISLSSLPEKAQVKWINANPEAARDMAGHIKDKLSPQAQWEITKLTAPVVAVSKEVLLNESAKKLLTRDVELLAEIAVAPQKGKGRKRYLEGVAQRYGLNVNTIYDIHKKYKKGGLENLRQPRQKKGPTAWDAEALDFMSGVYIKAVREGGDASKRFAYDAAVAKAKEMGWKVGSPSSAYEHLGKLNTLRNPAFECSDF